MSITRVRFLAAACLVSLAVAAESSPANAGESAVDLKKKGDEAFLALKYVDALKAYEASYQLTPNPALHFNRGRALEALERNAEAIDAFEAFLRSASPDLKAKAGKLPEHLVELRGKVATVHLKVSPNGARIIVRNIAVGTAPLVAPLRINAGAARVEVDADGHQKYSRDHDFIGGRETKLAIELTPKAAPVATAPTPAPEPKEESGGVLGKWWFWVGTGVIVVGAATVAIVIAAQPNEPKEGSLGQLNAPLLRF